MRLCSSCILMPALGVYLTDLLTDTTEHGCLINAPKQKWEVFLFFQLISVRYAYALASFP